MHSLPDLMPALPKTTQVLLLNEAILISPAFNPDLENPATTRLFDRIRHEMKAKKK